MLSILFYQLYSRNSQLTSFGRKIPDEKRIKILFFCGRFLSFGFQIHRTLRPICLPRHFIPFYFCIHIHKFALDLCRNVYRIVFRSNFIQFKRFSRVHLKLSGQRIALLNDENYTFIITIRCLRNFKFPAADCRFLCLCICSKNNSYCDNECEK